MTATIEGVGVTPRTAVGEARWLADRDPTDLAEPPAPGTVDADVERDRFERARESVRTALEAERDRTAERVGEEEAGVFDAHIEFLLDPGIEDGVTAVIADGLPADHAVVRAFADPIEQFEGMDGRMAERADDLREVRNRLLRELDRNGGDDDGDRDAPATHPDGAVLLADRLTPGDVTALDPDRVAGVVAATGGGTAHAAILLRSMAIPAVVGVGETLHELTDGTLLGVDGRNGVVHVDPDEKVRADLDASGTTEAIHGRVSTRDGTPIEVAANVGSAPEAAAAAREGADGVGLFRTEFLFLDRESPPDETEQYEAYRAALEAFEENGDGEGDRVVVRTLDVGGDKDVPYLDLDPVENGFLGVRGIRFSLSETGEELFETQLRALCRAAAHGPLAVMFPLVSTPAELDAAIDAVDRVLAELRSAGVDCARPELGAMVETPAAALSARTLAKRVSFLSIGTNDLSAYVMAAQRDLESVAGIADPLQPAVLSAIDRTVRGAHAEDAWVGVCGEAGGDPALTPLLVGLGVDELSMNAVSVPRVKSAVRSVDDDAAAELAAAALDAETPEQVRSLLPAPDE